MKRLLTFHLVLAMLWATPNVWGQSDTTMVTMPGTSIRLPLPDGFKMSSQFPGLIHENTATTVYAMEKAGTPFEMVVAAMDQDYFLSQDMTLISKENFNNQQYDGMLFFCAFQVDDVQFERAIYVTGDHNQTKVIIANYPEIAKHSLEVLVRETVSQVQF